MKRGSLIIVLLLLFASGWGDVLADSLCPHKRELRAARTAAPVAAHERGASCHAVMDDAADETTTAERHSASAEPGASFTGHTGACTHCLSRPESSSQRFAFARLTESAKREAGEAVAAHGLSLLSQLKAQHAQPVQARQHAPPVEQTPRHLLFNVFLI